MFTKNRINGIKICAGLFMLATVFAGYNMNVAPLYELTCISNTLCGIAVLTDGILGFRKQYIPGWIHHMLTTCISTVFLTVFFELSGYHIFNFSGAFLFLHAINPILMMTMYFWSSHDTSKWTIWMAPIPVMLYALFDIIRFGITGKLVYGLVTPARLTWFTTPLIGIGLYLFEVCLGLVLHYLKSTLRKNT